jgi:DNA gyrase subunit B
MADDILKNGEYGAKSIKVMEGLEAVRKRPAMYIGSTGPQGLHHLVYEVVDNSVDEALAGHCTAVNVILHTDGSCSVEDNGRGIPTDIHPTEGISAAEVVLTKLHAGGKFDKDSYKFSGGLHGVGISVVNALSEWLKLEIYQNGNVYTQLYRKGDPQGSLELAGKSTKRGTYVRFKPDPEIFKETTELSFDVLSARLRELAFLNKGLSISISDEANNKNHDFFFEGGIKSFIAHINKKKTPLFDDIIYFTKEDENNVLEVAMQYNDGYGEQLFSFVNNINTIDGGTHVSGFKSALTKVCNKRALELNVIKQNEEGFSSDDVREGLVAVISVKIPEPQFEGQTKGKLGNNEIKGIVDSWTFSFLDTLFEENPALARKILSKAEIAKRAREAAKKARDLTRRKTVLESTVLPGKLADCTSEEPSKSELFIVEGDSAGGSAKQARDRFIQAILPLRGKILNVEKARVDKILSNEEIKALITAVGGGIGKDFDAEKARYHKIILMTDADVDGSHIRTLLLTFFFRYMKPLIEKGYLFVAQPPLYKATIGRKEQYLKDDSEFTQFIFDWVRDHVTLTINGNELDHASWESTLDKLWLYQKQLHTVAGDFRLTPDQCHRLAIFTRTHPFKVGDSIEALINQLQNNYAHENIEVVFKPSEQRTLIADNSISEELTPEILENTSTTPIIDVITVNDRVVFTRHNRAWDISLNFFASEELADLRIHLDALNNLEINSLVLRVKDKERSITCSGIVELLRAIIEISKPYMAIQRYKGLGEMNPEQLWETSMDPAVRSLLRVKIEDALEADAWFATLMGDDVPGRRAFIEENGRFVKNLDI